MEHTISIALTFSFERVCWLEWLCTDAILLCVCSETSKMKEEKLLLESKIQQLKLEAVHKHVDNNISNSLNQLLSPIMSDIDVYNYIHVSIDISI